MKRYVALLLLSVAAFGQSATDPLDLNKDGAVNMTDATLAFSAWATAPTGANAGIIWALSYRLSKPVICPTLGYGLVGEALDGTITRLNDPNTPGGMYCPLVSCPNADVLGNITNQDGDYTFIGWYTRSSAGVFCEGYWRKINGVMVQSKCCAIGTPGAPLPTIP